MLAEFTWEVLFTDPFAVGIVAIVSFMAAGVINSIVTNWRKVRVAEQAAALKQSMIERGMSAEDIERVLKAGAPAKPA
jgi:hypothetical protein